MKAHVKILRANGERRSPRDIAADPGAHGELRLMIVEGIAQANLCDLDDQQFKPLIPMLYHARLVTMHGNTMLFHGLTRRREDGGVPQEWACRCEP